MHEGGVEFDEVGAGCEEGVFRVFFVSDEISPFAFVVCIESPFVVCLPAVGMSDVGFEAGAQRSRARVVIVLLLAAFGDESSRGTNGGWGAGLNAEGEQGKANQQKDRLFHILSLCSDDCGLQNYAIKLDFGSLPLFGSFDTGGLSEQKHGVRLSSSRMYYTLCQ